MWVDKWSWHTVIRFIATNNTSSQEIFLKSFLKFCSKCYRIFWKILWRYLYYVRMYAHLCLQQIKTFKYMWPYNGESWSNYHGTHCCLIWLLYLCSFHMLLRSCYITIFFCCHCRPSILISPTHQHFIGFSIYL